LSEREETTAILVRLGEGDPGATERLLPILYEELHRLARRSMRGERPDHTLQPTALVHEAYLRLVDQDRTDWKSRAHFMAIAARTIRRILVDHARGAATEKRGGGRECEPLSGVGLELAAPDLDLLALEEALEQLGALHERQRDVVELRFFGGLEVQQVAEVLGVSETTVKEDWRLARAWLRRRLDG